MADVMVCPRCGRRTTKDDYERKGGTDVLSFRCLSCGSTDPPRPVEESRLRAYEGRQTSFYAKVAVAVAATTILLFLLFPAERIDLPTVEDYAFFAMYLLVWLFFLFGLLSKGTVFVLTRALGMDGEGLARRGIRGYFIGSFVIPLLLSGVVFLIGFDMIWVMGVFLISLQVEIWIRDALKPKKEPPAGMAS